VLTLALGCGSVESRVSVPASPAPRVHVAAVADRPAALVDAADREVCATPCTVDVDPRSGPFVARIPEMPDSPPFELPPVESLQVTIVGGAPVLPGLAAVVGTVGGVGMAIGLTVLFADVGGVRDLDGLALPAGLVTAGASVVLSAGFVLWALSGTHVTLDEGKIPF
jgi:hypothetical protein